VAVHSATIAEEIMRFVPRHTLLALLLALVTLPILPASAAPAAAPAGFVTRSGRDFMLDGAPFRFVGANMYNAAGDPSIYECGPWMSNPDVELDAWFAHARTDFGARVVRFWAFQRYTNGGTDWRSFDRVMRTANKYGVKVLPVLENQWGDCSLGGARYDTWYSGGYKQAYGGYPLSYQEYVRRVVQRYRNEPAVFAWMLMNEAEGRTASGAEAADALYTFTRDMSSYVKARDPNHLVTLGTIGGGQPGVRDANYERLLGISTVDFGEFHDYNSNDVPMPGAPITVTAPIQTAIFAQDGTWAWQQAGYQTNLARSWETLTWTLPAGAAPFQRLGIIVYGAYTGAAYLDRIEVGSRVYDFEDGTIQGFNSTATIVLTNSTTVHESGARALKLSFNQANGSGQVRIPVLPTDGPGTVVKVRMYVDTPGTLSPQNTLATAMYKAGQLGKPLLVGEAGMTACGSWNGSQAETGASRASRFDAKLTAFFGNGGAGYLVWAWEPDNSCNYAFGPGDPLNGVLQRAAAALTP
jgi:mannan endo-1,4-beta-mannosidase